MTSSVPMPSPRHQSASVRGCLLILLLAAAPVRAIDITVDILGDPEPNGCTPGHCSLREAVILANSLAGPDRILLPATPGVPLQLTIPGAGENASATGDLNVLDDLEIIGTGADTTVLVQTIADRVLQTSMTADRRLVLRGLTVQGGRSFEGGALRASSRVTIEDAAFVGNSVTQYGGAISLSAAYDPSIAEPRLVLRRVRFEDNVATQVNNGLGGALYATTTIVGAPFILIEDSRFIDNEGKSGGGAIALRGISNSGGDVTIRRTTFNGNRAGGSGGAAMAVLSSSFVTRIEDSVLDANVTTSTNAFAGGAFHAEDGISSTVMLRTTLSSNSGNRGGAVYSNWSLQLIDSLLRDNTASFSGGAVSGSRTVVVDRSTFDSNRVTSTDAADEGGGAIRFGGDTLLIQRSTFSGNDAYRGGAISLASGKLQLYRSTLAAGPFGIAGRQGTILRMLDDTPGNAQVIANTLLAGTCTFPSGRQWAVAYNTIESPGNTCRLTTASQQAQNEVSATSAQLALGGLADNGGPTPTRMPGAGSIAIDTGRESYCSPADQRRYARADSLCDIGAVEVGATQDELFRHSFE